MTQKSKSGAPQAQVGAYLGVGLQFALTIALCAYGGWWVDARWGDVPMVADRRMCLRFGGRVLSSISHPCRRNAGNRKKRGGGDIVTGEPWVAVLCGIGVAAASALIALIGLRWSASRPRLVVAVVLGGTLIRLLLVTGCSVLLLGFTDVDSLVYATSLIVSYLGFLGVEIFMIARRRGPQTETQT